MSPPTSATTSAPTSQYEIVWERRNGRLTRIGRHKVRPPQPSAAPTLSAPTEHPAASNRSSRVCSETAKANYRNGYAIPDPAPPKMVCPDCWGDGQHPGPITIKTNREHAVRLGLPLIEIKWCRRCNGTGRIKEDGR